MKIKSSAPGRICLFGEHQDYLGFPVIAAAIDLRVEVEGSVSSGSGAKVDLRDLKEIIEFSFLDISYTHKQDYLRSVVNVLKKKGFYTPRQIEAAITGNVPIRSGTSSSAAFSVSWTGFLLEAMGHYRKGGFQRDPAAVAELAYQAEVIEFNESGGRMDQYTSAIGGIVYLDFYDLMTPTPLPQALHQFVLGDSLQPKDTQKTLKRVRTAQEDAFLELSKHLKFKDNFHITYDEAEPYFDRISSELLPYLKAALMNHHITDAAREEISKQNPDILRIADLMNRHQDYLRDNLRISTEKIDHMLNCALEAGALAGKINGSGEGGCMFAFCPGKQQEVAEAIKKAGGVPYIINIGKGLEVLS